MEYKVMEVEDSETSDVSEFGGLCVDDLDVDKVLKMQFDSVEDAEKFYNLYAKCVKFSIRKDDVLRDTDGTIKMRKFVCHRQGFRRDKNLEDKDRVREPRALTRVGCEAAFRVKLDEGLGKFVVTNFVKEHNHEMADSCSVSFLRSHRSVNDSDIAQARTMHEVGWRTSDIMKLFAHQAGGYDKVGFTLKDLYNRLYAERREEIKDGDAEGALGYLSAKKENDPLFFYKYDVDEDQKLCRLFWADSRCRTDYNCFGDVLVFDTTYKTNAYRKPLVMLVGINNHYMTTVFACALLSDETTDTYVWVLETLFECMHGKKPISVVTDGDLSMRNAIDLAIPDARHRLCSWHLHGNVKINVKSLEFIDGFNKCMTEVQTVNEFERAWRALVDNSQPTNVKYVEELYNTRSKWAEAYLRGHFFANVRANQRCEGIHAFMKKHVDEKLRLFEFVKSFDLGLAWLRNQECAAHTETKETDPVMSTHLKDLEASASEQLTRNVFFLVRMEMEKEVDFFVHGREDGENEATFTIESYSIEGKSWRVRCDENNEQLRCSCLLLESIGWPCAHMFSVMKYLRMKRLPQACINTRWTMDARTSMEPPSQQPISSDVTQQARYGILTTYSNRMCYLASLTDEAFNNARDMIAEVIEDLELKRASKVGLQGDVEDVGGKKVTSQLFNVKDPVHTRTKGAPTRGTSSKGKPRRCGNCRGFGHKRTTCTKRRNKKNHENESKKKKQRGSTYKEEASDVSFSFEGTSGDGVDEDLGTNASSDSD